MRKLEDGRYEFIITQDDIDKGRLFFPNGASVQVSHIQAGDLLTVPAEVCEKE